MESLLTLAPTCCLRPPILFIKNSSRLAPTIARKKNRSRRGFLSSWPSCKTRLLNSSQVSSRLRYHSGDLRSKFFGVAIGVSVVIGSWGSGLVCNSFGLLTILLAFGPKSCNWRVRSLRYPESALPTGYAV